MAMRVWPRHRHGIHICSIFAGRCIGKKREGELFAYSVRMHPERDKGKVVLSDTTVQENNTTSPTDAKLFQEVLNGSNHIAKIENIDQR